MIDAAAERAVLAGLFSGGHDALVDVADLLTPECFQQGKNSSYYKVLSKMLAEPNSKADVPTFYSVAKSLNLYHIFEDQEEQKFLRALTITSVEQNNVRKLAAKLLKLIKIEQYSNVLSDASDKLSKFSGDESIGQILSVGEEAVLEFSSTLGEQSETVRKYRSTARIASVLNLIIPFDFIIYFNLFLLILNCYYEYIIK